MGLISLRSCPSCARLSEESTMLETKKVIHRKILSGHWISADLGSRKYAERKKLLKLIYCFKLRKNVSKSEKFSRNKNNSLETQDD